jgi:hypothetical protein
MRFGSWKAFNKWKDRTALAPVPFLSVSDLVQSKAKRGFPEKPRFAF